MKDYGNIDINNINNNSITNFNNNNNDNYYIPWSDTNMIKGNRLVLNDMYNNYSDNSTIKQFLDVHLLKEPSGNTGISYYEVSKEVILNNKNTVNFNTTFTVSQFNNESGVYIVQDNLSDDKYVGSATLDDLVIIIVLFEIFLTIVIKVQNFIKHYSLMVLIIIVIILLKLLIIIILIL